jgi:hypothetical protein
MAGATGEAEVKTICQVCIQESEWRYKNGWGVLACADWFAGLCEGKPLGIIFPYLINLARPEDVVDVNAAYADWLTQRVRALWPPEKSA